ncbi:hypothetical protein HDU88_008867 [Geranomyces variabilis]|nr:hypothetical protein HDU88_008867 [Geranomyces variabilis]
MGKRKNWFGGRSRLALSLHSDADTAAAIRPDPPAATPQGVAAASDLNAKRRVYVNTPLVPPYIDTRTNEPVFTFPSNKVRTSKYSPLTFLPKNLFEQFRSVANFYFTSLVILQAFPPFNQVSVVLTGAPVVIIVAATAIKDAIEDYKRHRADASVNKAHIYLLENWENVNAVEAYGWRVTARRLNKRAKKALAGLFRAVRDLIVAKKGAKGPPKPAALRAQDYVQQVSSPPSSGSESERESGSGVGGGAPAAASLGGSPHSYAPAAAAGDDDESMGPLWTLSKWENVRVGDFVLLQNNDPIPADIVIVSTSEPDGLCYVETKNLDGETNLKVRRGVPALDWVSTPEDCTKIQAWLDSEPPTSNLYTYNGVLHIPDPASLEPITPSRLSSSSRRSGPAVRSAGGDQTEMMETRRSGPPPKPDEVVSLSTTSLLLRGCVLRNTRWLIGLAVYTGTDTKIMLNSGKTPSKRSRIDRQINPQVLVNFMLLSGMCMVCAVVAAIYSGSFGFENAMFAGVQFDAIIGGPAAKSDFETPSYTAFVTFFLCMIIFQAIIPIALVISVELAKLFQSAMIHFDEDMYDPESERHATPQAWNLCDDLGQIEYIFSDKTGTLTCNMMEFRKCTINGASYGGTFVSEAAMGAAEREGRVVDEDEANARRAEVEKEMREGMKQLGGDRYAAEQLSFVDAELVQHLRDNNVQSRRIREFFTLLAVCHTVLVEKPDQSNPDALEYKAQSPDEAALVAAARDVGFAFLERNDNRVTVDVMGQRRTYTILHVLEFNSDRKRMSVIIQRPEGDMILLCKGADSIIYDRLSKDNDQDLMDVTSQHLESFANEGLRTLCLSYRPISHEQYVKWERKYRAAQALIENRDEETDAVAETIERDLILMGATAIEDKLQEGVPETIALLAKAGIKIWVLTGDKMETAINIGFAANLLRRDMTLIVVRSASLDATFRQLTEALERFWNADGQATKSATTDGVSDGADGGSAAAPPDSYAFIIDGESLKFALEPRCKALLLELGCRCAAVVCCRVSPLQKAMVVQLVRKGLGAMCLAVGDGANDVSMIQEADVGIGIAGKEGLQAVMAADYSVGQFRFLGRLLLVHGRWAYMRTAEMVLNYFYKNVVYLFVLFWYQFDNGFSASTITDYTYSMFFNTLFSLLPTIALGTLDQDVNDRISMLVPQLYLKGIRQTLYTMERFWLYLFDGIYQSVVCYFFAYFLYRDSITNHQGWDSTKDDMGTFLAMSIIITVNLYAAMCFMNWTWIVGFAVVATLLIWIIYLMIFVTQVINPEYGQAEVLLRSVSFWAGVLVTVVVALGPKFVYRYAAATLWPSDTDLVREMQKQWHEGEDLPLDGTARRPSRSRHHLHRGSDEPRPSNLDIRVDALTPPTPSTGPRTMKKTFSDCVLAARRRSAANAGVADQRRIHSDAIGSVAPPPLPHPPPLMIPASLANAGAGDGFGTDRPSVTGTAGRRRHPSAQTTASSTNNNNGLAAPGEDGINTLERERRGSRARNISAAVVKAGSNLVKKIRRRKGHVRTGSLVVYMGADGDDEDEAVNTGFAFSHDGGMCGVITPTRPPAPPRTDSNLDSPSQPDPSPGSGSSNPFNTPAAAQRSSPTAVRRLANAFRQSSLGSLGRSDSSLGGPSHHSGSHQHHGQQHQQQAPPVVGVAVAGLVVGAVGAAFAGAVRVGNGPAVGAVAEEDEEIGPAETPRKKDD